MTQYMIPKQTAQELTLMQDETKIDGWAGEVLRVVRNRNTGEQKRWTSIHEIIVETRDGRFWRRLYEEGLTESQCNVPFDCEGPGVVFDQVTPYTVERTEYRLLGT